MPTQATWTSDVNIPCPLMPRAHDTYVCGHSTDTCDRATEAKPGAPHRFSYAGVCMAVQVQRALARFLRRTLLSMISSSLSSSERLSVALDSNSAAASFSA